MTALDLYAEAKAFELMPADSYSASTEGSSIDVAGCEGVAILVLSCEAGSGGTFDGVLEESDDDSTFTTAKDADDANIAITQVTDAANSYQVIPIDLRRLKRYLRFNPFLII
jgi:hypothetical protein